MGLTNASSVNMSFIWHADITFAPVNREHLSPIEVPSARRLYRLRFPKLNKH